MGRGSSLIWKVLVCVLLAGGIALAQMNTGTILGTVSDSTGAVIPGATITVRNVETGITRTVTTDAAGRYRALQLGLGNYAVTAESAGFQTVVRSGITLTVGREAAVDFSMQVGAVTERITVTGEAPLVEATSSTVSSVVEGETIRELPLNGRSFDQLALLQPGVFMARAVSEAAPGRAGNSTWISISGSRPGQSVTLYDGTNINNQFNLAGAGVGGRLLGVDAVREFRLLTNNYSAEFGRAVGGVITVVTRSGTNEFHGSAFEFLRNSALAAKNYFDLKTAPIPSFKRNQFGASLGGPIKRDQIFFFVVYEGLRDRLGKRSAVFVPNAAVHSGFLPNATNPSVLDNVGVNAAVKPFLDLYPLPNGRDVGGGLGEFTTSATQPTTQNFGQGRIDYQINAEHSIFGRYTFDKANLVDPYHSALPGYPRPAKSGNHYVTLQLTSIVTPTVLNTARFGLTRVWNERGSIETPTGDPRAILRFGTPHLRPGVVVVSGGVASLGLATSGGNGRVVRNLFEYSDDLSVTKGAHALKFGVLIERFQDFFAEDYLVTGEYTFGNLRNFLRNIPARFRGSLPGAQPIANWRQTLFGFYGQDDFRVNSRLTLNLGLRYEFVTLPINVNSLYGGRIGVLKDTLRDTKFVEVETPFPKNFSLKNIAPRVGFAWDIFGDGKTAVRGGFGLAYDQILANFYAFDIYTPPLISSLRLVSPDLSFPNPFTSIPIVGTNQPLEYNVCCTPMVMQYNFNIQRQLSSDIALQVGYIGSRGIHQVIGKDTNTPIPTILPDGRYFIPPNAPPRNPNFGELGLKFFEGQSRYDSLQIGMQKRLSRGFMVSANYTWSNSMDHGSQVRSGEGLSSREGLQNPDCLRCDWGRSDFNRGQVFSGTYSYELPFGPGRAIGGNLTGVAGKLVGGWEFSGITTLNSGLPGSAYTNFDRAGLRTVSSTLALRPDLKPGASNNPTEGVTTGCTGVAAGQKLRDPDRWFDPCAFALQPAGHFGNLGRATLTGPGLVNYDFSIVKNTRWGEARNLQFRTEVFNIFNHPNFVHLGGAGNVFASASGVPSATAGRLRSTTTNSRQIQLGLKLTF